MADERAIEPVERAAIAVLAAISIVALTASCRHDASSAASGPEASLVVESAASGASPSADGGAGVVAAGSVAEASRHAPPPAGAAADARLTAARRPGCEGVAARAVNSLPEVKRATARAMEDARKSGGRTHFGGVGPIDDPDDGFTAGIGGHTDERFEAVVWYTVDGAGHLSVTVNGEEQQVGPDTLRKVEQACGP